MSESRSGDMHSSMDASIPLDPLDQSTREKFIHELRELGMYEPGMEDDDMANLLKVVKESKTISQQATVKNEAQLASQLDSKSSEKMQPGYSHSKNETSGQPSEDSKLSAQSTSSTSIKETESPMSSTQKFANSKTEDSTVARTINKRSSQTSYAQISRGGKNPESKTNTLEYGVDPKHMPLQTRPRLHNDHCCNETGGDGASHAETTMNQLSNHLRQIAETLAVQHRSSVASKFSWGSAIKVGHSNGKINAIMSDKKASEYNDDSNEPIEANDSEAARRHLTRWTDQSPVYCDIISDQEEIRVDNSDEEFQPKRQKTGKTRSKRMAKSTARESSIEPDSTHMSDTVDSRLETRLSDDEGVIQPPKKMQCSEPMEVDSVYPRRIVPPIPGAKHRRRAINAVQSEKVTKKTVEQTTSVAGSEIVDLLCDDAAGASELNVRDNRESDLMEKVYAESRQSRISERMKIQSENLATIKEREKQEEENNRREEILSRERIALIAEQRVRNRIKKAALEVKQQEEAEKTRLEREESWRARQTERERKQTTDRTDLYPDGPARVNDHILTTNEYEPELEVNRGQDTADEGALCPICNKIFKIEEIVAHAGGCEEFEVYCFQESSQPNAVAASPRQSSQQSRPSKEFHCDVCDDFTTDNGKIFEDHSTECIRRKRYEPNAMNDGVVAVPTSPLRTFGTISQQPDSGINYRQQFSTVTRPRSNTSKKRKR